MKRSAFTMLELIFVIVVIGILAVLAMPNFNTNPLQTASEQLASHIRYTKHLAMVDDEFDPANATWYNRRWMLDICQPAYKLTRFDGTQTATDPLSNMPIDGSTNENFNLAGRFDVTIASVTANNCKIVFDNMGRPYSFTSAGSPASAFDGIRDTNLTIVLTHTDGTATLNITPETGYVQVVY